MTLLEIQTALIENADFQEAASVTKAKAYITAATRWFSLAPNSSSQGGASLSMNSQQIESRLKRAEAYVEANDTAANNSRRRPSVRYAEVISRW